MSRLSKMLKVIPFLTSILLFSSSFAPVYANDKGASKDSSTVIEETYVEDTKEEKDDKIESHGFTEPGNGNLVDQLSDKDGKEFYTITTENNNTFYIIIDHARSSDNVYMLSTIDENDLKDFIEEKETVKPQQQVVIPEKEPVKEETEVVVKEEKKGNSSLGFMAILVCIGAVITGGYYYINIYKPKHEGDFNQDDEEDLEYDHYEGPKKDEEDE